MRLRAIGAGLAVTLILLVALPLCIRYGPAWIVGDTPGLTPVDRLKAENDARSALVQGFVGFLALGGATLGVVATISQVRANRRGRATDLFIKAIELLAADRTQIRMGGVYALEQPTSAVRICAARSWSAWT